VINQIAKFKDILTVIINIKL